MENGYRILSEWPGIGVEIAEAALAKYPYERVAIHGSLHADGQ